MRHPGNEFAKLLQLQLIHMWLASQQALGWLEDCADPLQKHHPTAVRSLHRETGSRTEWSASVGVYGIMESGRAVVIEPWSKLKILS